MANNIFHWRAPWTKAAEVNNYTHQSQEFKIMNFTHCRISPLGTETDFPLLRGSSKFRDHRWSAWTALSISPSLSWHFLEIQEACFLLKGPLLPLFQKNIYSGFWGLPLKRLWRPPVLLAFFLVGLWMNNACVINILFIFDILKVCISLLCLFRLIDLLNWHDCPNFWPSYLGFSLHCLYYLISPW